jgi:predicted nuclease of predicted toxin-antitoxin system
MTAHDTNLPNTSADPDATTGVGVTRVSRDGARDKAAVIVWHIAADAADDPAAAVTPDAVDSPLTSRLARHLVAIYSDVHGTVIDFDADANLRHAAEATGRTYLAVTNPAGPTASAGQPRPAVLIMLRWPRPATTAPGQDANSLFSACRQHLADDGSTIIVVVTAASAGVAGTRYGEHEQVLLPAAEAAGLRHLHDIVPLDADDGRDVFTYATARDTTASSRDSDSDTPRQITSTTLVIFGHPGRRP